MEGGGKHIIKLGEIERNGWEAGAQDSFDGSFIYG